MQFLNSRFSNPSKGPNSPQEGPKVPKWTQQDTISAYCKALVLQSDFLLLTLGSSALGLSVCASRDYPKLA